MYCMWWESWKETLWSQTLKKWRRWSGQNSTPEGANAKEVLTPMKSENFIFPIADGPVTTPGGDQDLKTSTLTWDCPDRGEEQWNLPEESDRSSSTSWQDPSWYDGETKNAPLRDDSTLDAAEAKNDFWSITGDFICRHHVEPRAKLYVSREESFLVPLEYIDVARTTHTSLDVTLEKMSKIIGTLMEIENCQIRGQVSQVLPYWEGNHLTGIRGPGGVWQESNRPPDQTLCFQRYGKICRTRRSEETSKSGTSKNRSSTVLEDCVVSISLILMMRNSRISCSARRKLATWDVQGKFVAQLKNTRQKILLHCCSLWFYEEPHGRVARIQLYVYASSNKNTRCKGSSAKYWEKFWKIPAWNLTKVLTKVRNKKEVIDEARKLGKTNCTFASFMDLAVGSLSSQEFGVRA